MAGLAVVTGAGSGIGFEMARLLRKKGYFVILVGHDRKKLREAGERLKAERPKGKKMLLFSCDLSRSEECLRLCETFQNWPVDLLVNCAGVGVYGDFDALSLQAELNMLAVNCRAVHILMKEFLKDMEKRGRGQILNVASSAGLMPGGPYMTAYYASKAYVVSLTWGAAEELRAKNSPVYVGVLCPGPVKTPFFERAGIRAGAGGADPEKTAQAAWRGMRKKKMVIVPDAVNRIAWAAAKLLPDPIVLAVNKRIQVRKMAGKRRR